MIGSGLTPAEFAWERLLELRIQQHRNPSSAAAHHRGGAISALAKVLAHVPGTYATFEPDKILIAADRAVRRLQGRP